VTTINGVGEIDAISEKLYAAIEPHLN
jgi:hypothetical protein